MEWFERVPGGSWHTLCFGEALIVFALLCSDVSCVHVEGQSYSWQRVAACGVHEDPNIRQ